MEISEKTRRAILDTAVTETPARVTFGIEDNAVEVYITDSDTFNAPGRYLLETSMRCIPRNDGTGGYMGVSDCGFGSEVREVAGTLEELLDDRQRQALKALRDEGASIEAWNEYHTVTDGMLIINDSLQLKQVITD